MHESTLHRWKHQDRIDQGLVSGTSSCEGAQLKAARRRIRELEAELAAAKRASELFAEGRVMRPEDLYPIVEALGAEGHGLKASCRLLGVSASGLFHWRDKPLPARAVRRAWLADAVAEIWERSRRTYGWRRIQAELTEVYDHRASRKLLRSVMREQGICGLPRHKSRRRDLSRVQTTADLVNREFVRDGPNQLWMTDITEPPDTRGQALLLRGARRVVPKGRGPGPVDRRPTAAMVNSALAMAIASPKTAPRRGSSLRPRAPIHVLGVQPAGPIRGAGAVFGHSRRRIRQRGGRVVLGRACRPSCSTPRNGRPESSCPPRSSTGLNRSTIEPGATRPSATSHPPSSSDATNNQTPPDSHKHSPKNGAHINRTHKRVPVSGSAKTVNLLQSPSWMGPLYQKHQPRLAHSRRDGRIAPTSQRRCSQRAHIPCWAPTSD